MMEGQQVPMTSYLTAQALTIDNLDGRNNEVSAAFALDANIIPDFGPNTKAAIEAAETKHPNLWFANSIPGRDICETNVASKRMVNSIPITISPFFPKTDFAAPAIPSGVASSESYFVRLIHSTSTKDWARKKSPDTCQCYS